MGQYSHKLFYPSPVKISVFHDFLLGDVSLLGPQSETVGVYQFCIWLSSMNMSISHN